MRKFGFTRLYRGDISLFHKIYFMIFGVCSDHKLRFLYARKLTRQLAAQRPLSRILDAGCGSGDYSFYYADRHPDCEVLGIDIQEDLIRRNQSLVEKVGFRNLKFAHRDLMDLDADGVFDFIGCVDVLEHLRDQRKILTNLHRALTPRGLLLVHIPLQRARPVIFDRLLVRFHEWTEEKHVAPPHTRESCLALLEECGFKPLEVRNTFNHYLGELAVSIIMLFFSNTLLNRIMLSLLTPLLCILIYLDIAIKNKSGNGIAVLAAKA